MTIPLPENAGREEVRICRVCQSKRLYRNGKPEDMASAAWPVPVRIPAIIQVSMEPSDCPWCVLRQPLPPASG